MDTNEDLINRVTAHSSDYSGSEPFALFTYFDETFKKKLRIEFGLMGIALVMLVLELTTKPRLIWLFVIFLLIAIRVFAIRKVYVQKRKIWQYFHGTGEGACYRYLYAIWQKFLAADPVANLNPDERHDFIVLFRRAEERFMDNTAMYPEATTEVQQLAERVNHISQLSKTEPSLAAR